MVSDITLHCRSCRAQAHGDAYEGRCPACGGLAEVHVDLERAGRAYEDTPLAERPADLRRWRELLPLRDVEPALMPIVSPLRPAPRLARQLGLAEILVKDEAAQPSGALKDRSSAIGVARAAALGYSDIACASSGNAATSMAAMAAAAGLRAHIFVPAHVPTGKLRQAQAYGAQVFLVEGTYEQAYALCEEATAEFGWYNRNCAQNPYLVEGKKTCGLEIAEQLGERRADWLVVAVGDGCTVAGIWKGLREMRSLGLGGEPPRVLAVQSARAAVLHDAWRERTSVAEVAPRYADPQTIADAIAVAEPHNGDRAIEAVEASGGAFVAIADDEMREAILTLGASSGLFADPAAAGCVAAIASARSDGLIRAEDRVVVALTGSGLKNADAVEPVAAPPRRVRPELAALEAPA